MPYKTEEDAKKYQKEYNQRPEVKEKGKQNRQRPEVKEKQREYNKQYKQVQNFKKRQEIGEERWYKNQIDGFNRFCGMYFADNNLKYTGDYETYRNSRNHELLYLIHEKTLAYNDWLETDKNNHPPI